MIPPIAISAGTACRATVALPDATKRWSVRNRIRRPRGVTAVATRPPPALRATASMRRSSCPRSRCSRAVSCAARAATGGAVAGNGGAGGLCSADAASPSFMIARPPESTGPQKATWSDSRSSLTLAMFVEEIANRTTNTVNSSVIVS